MENSQKLHANTSDDEDIFDEIPSRIDIKQNQLNGSPTPVFSLDPPTQLKSTQKLNGINGALEEPKINSLSFNDRPISSSNEFLGTQISDQDEESSEEDIENSKKEENTFEISDLSKSLTSKYFIQVVRISLNESEIYNGSDSFTKENEKNISNMSNVPSNKILYTIRSLKKFGRKSIFMVNRFHEDIEWLDHCLLTQNKALGLIIPPIPTKPLEHFQLSSFNGSLTQLGNNERNNENNNEFVSGALLSSSYNYVQADNLLTKSPYDRSILQHINHSFNYDCFNLERYLTLLLQHPVFGTDVSLKRFLSEKNAPPHGKFKKGFLDRFTTAVGEMRKAHQVEFDEFFQHERFWNTEYTGLLRDVLTSFSKKVEAIYQLAQVSGHFSTALSMAHCTGPSLYNSFNQTLTYISSLFENLKQKNEELQAYYQLTLGFELDFYCRYLESHKDTLNRRNCLLLEYESSNKAFERAKPPKKEIARQMKIICEKTLKDCSDTAKQEFTRFHSDQSTQILNSIQNYANANLQKSKDIYDAIAFSLDQLLTTI